MSNRMEISLTGDTFTDELHYDCGSSAFMLSELAGYPDPIENLGHDFFTKEDLVIRTASGGGGTLLAEGAGNDYLLLEEDTDLTSRVTAAVGSTRTVYKKIQIINATYQSGALYFSGKYIADANSAENYNWQRNRPQQVNDIINGSMELNQRSTPGATYAAVTDGQYTIDRFEYQKGGAGVTAVHSVIHSTTTPDDEINYSYHLDCTTAEAAVAADEYVIISHKIEGYNYQKYIGNTGTLSFWVYADKIGTYCVAFRNSGTDRCYIVEYEIRQTLTWERKVISVDFDYSGGTWDTTNGVGLEIDWVIMGGSDYQNTADQWNNTDDFCTSNQVNGCDSTDNDFYLAKVKFEPGDRATKFWQPDISELIRKCQRYYEKSYDYDVAIATVTNIGNNVRVDCITGGIYNIKLKMTKGDTPTITTYSPVTGTINKYHDYTSASDFNSTISNQGLDDYAITYTNHGAADEVVGFHYTAVSEL